MRAWPARSLGDRIRDPHDPLRTLPYFREHAARELRTARREGWAHLALGRECGAIKTRAMHPVLGQLRMIESAIRMTVQMDHTLAAWRQAA